MFLSRNDFSLQGMSHDAMAFCDFFVNVYHIRVCYMAKWLPAAFLAMIIVLGYAIFRNIPAMILRCSVTMRNGFLQLFLQ